MPKSGIARQLPYATPLTIRLILTISKNIISRHCGTKAYQYSYCFRDLIVIQGVLF